MIDAQAANKMAKNRKNQNRMRQSSAKKKGEDVVSYDAQRLLDLEKLEDQIDLEEARIALADVEKCGTISWEAIKADLKL